MAVKIGHASISEKGTIRGSAGDQNGKEVCTRSWYRHSKGWITLRCTVPGMAEYIAEGTEKACANPDIGYDQIENQTLWNNVKDKDFDPSKTTKKVETDCARLMRLVIQYALRKMGMDATVPDFYTATLATVLVRTGWFEKLTADKYNKQDDYLLRGDIQVTKTKGHTWCILTNGSKAEVPAAPEQPLVLGDRDLRNGCEGEDVKELQSLLIQLDYDLGRWGADGDFGDATESAVRRFQTKAGLDIDGVVSTEELAAIDDMLDTGDAELPDGAKLVRVTGDSVNIRTGPGAEYTSIHVAHKGDTFALPDATGWLPIIYGGHVYWISDKYADMVKG